MAHFHKLKSFIGNVILLLLLSVAATAQPLSGVYTVGGVTPSYPTLTDAVNDLLANGVSGPVTFNLRNGTYSGAQYSIGTITGASATNRVTFQSETGLPANVTVSYPANGSGDNYVFQLDGASFVTLKDLTLTNTATADYACAIQLVDNASDNLITNCEINTAVTGASSTDAALIYADAFTGSNNTFVNNVFTAGAYAIYLNGNSSSDIWSNATIRDNTFTDQSYYGIYNNYGIDLKILNNTFSTTTYQYTGIYCANSEGVIQINNNTLSVNTDDWASAYGIDVEDCYGTSGNPLEIHNNSIDVTNISAGPTTGIYTNGVEYVSIVQNTINTTGVDGTNSPLYNRSSPNSDISKNTITSTVDWGNTEIALLDDCADSYFGENQLTVTGGLDGEIYLYGITYGSDNSTIYKNTFDITGTSNWQYTETMFSQDATNCVVRKNNITITSEYVLENYVNHNTEDAIADSNTFTLTSNYDSWDGGVENFMGDGSINGLIDNNNIEVVCQAIIHSFMANGADGLTISNNSVHAELINSLMWEVIGVNISNSTNTKLNLNKIFVKSLNTNGPTIFGISADNSNGLEVINNSISNIGTNNAWMKGLYITSVGNSQFRNNSVFNQGSGYAVDASNWNNDPSFINTVLYNNAFISTSGSAYGMNTVAGTMYTSDYNLYYSASNVFSNQNIWPNQNFSLTGYRAATGNDKNSLQYNAAAAWPNRATGDLTPSATAPEVWAINGRGIHDAIVPEDITGALRPATRADGVPDLGAYEVLPTSIPPDAVANPAFPATGMQYFTFGLDTVASIDWTTATVPANVIVKQYSGEQPSTFTFPYFMYFHTDVDAGAGSFPHTMNVYYKDPWTGTTAAETGLRLIKRVGTGAWSPYTAPTSTTYATRNMISTINLTDFGDHTGSDVDNNASVDRLTAPTPGFCAPNTQTVKVMVKNTGNNVINTLKVDWYMNNAFQGTVNYTTPISTSQNPPDEAEITLGNYNFTNSKPVKLVAYVYDPNGVKDSAPIDDTLKVTINPGLSGDYTVGGAPTPDFVDVKEAVDILNMWGVCGPTTFKIRDSVGAYQGAGVIKAPILGGSVVNRVTFRAQDGNPNNVVINGTDLNPVFGLDNVTDVTLKNIKIVSLGSVGISVAGAPQRDTIHGCIIEGVPSTNYEPLRACISSMDNTYQGFDNAFVKNTFTGSEAGVALISDGNYDAYNNVVDSNDFSNLYIWGIYTEYLKSSKIRGNMANNLETPYNIRQTSTYDTDPIQIIGNIANNNDPSAFMGISFGEGVIGTFDTRATIAYNKVNALCNAVNNTFTSYIEYTDVYNNDVRADVNDGVAFGSQYSDAIYSNIYNNTIEAKFKSPFDGFGFAFRQGYFEGNKIYNNTVSTLSSGSSVKASYIEFSSSSNNNEVYNNVFVNQGTGGVGMAWNNSGSDNKSDYNNIYSANGSHFNINGTDETSLNEWRINQQQELNSICYQPAFIGMGDLHPNPANAANWSLNGRAIQITDNNQDRDGNARVTDVLTGVSDIGAYEFEPTVIPPVADATPALPAAGITQYFTFGQDTVATIDWNRMSIVSNTIEVRQYSGRKGTSYPSGLNYMFFYTDVNTQNVSANYTANLYYKDIWMGNISSESNLRLLKKLNTNPWVAYNGGLSIPDVDRNIITATRVTSTGMMTGVDDGGLFSAVITPMTSTTFCTGGSVVLQANTGSGYTYQWYRGSSAIPSATGSSYVASVAGNYSVQITDPNAMPSAVTATAVEVGVAVIAPPSAIITANGPLTYCNGGSLTLMANTGAQLWYQWQLNGNNIAGATESDLDVTASGNYTVTVSNLGCGTTSTITTINQGPLNVKLGEDTSFCESQVLVLDAGYPGAHYLWNTGDTTQKINITNMSGDYSVLVDAGTNCQARDTINVHIDPLPSVVGISYLSMGGSTFQFAPSGQQDVNSYMWMFSDGAVDFNQNTTHTFAASADWIATLVVFNDCGTDTST
ncbi:MAG: right-handed parallel beta-helix repeat-containing protein, partial [Sphingobacteriales bacterium]